MSKLNPDLEDQSSYEKLIFFFRIRELSELFFTGHTSMVRIDRTYNMRMNEK